MTGLSSVAFRSGASGIRAHPPPPRHASAGTDFNFDYRVSFTPDELATGAVDYNYGERKTAMTELPGISVFHKDEAGQIFHTYVARQAVRPCTASGHAPSSRASATSPR